MKQVVCGNLDGLMAIMGRACNDAASRTVTVQYSPRPIGGVDHVGWSVRSHLVNEVLETWVGILESSATAENFCLLGRDLSHIFRSERGRQEFGRNFLEAHRFGTLMMWPDVPPDHAVMDEAPGVEDEPEYSRWDEII